MKTPSLLLALIISILLIQCIGNNRVTAQQLDVINRNISDYDKAGGSAVEMDAQPGDGIAVLKDTDFETGVIEINLLGENNPGKSFIGVAFNIQNDSTYEAIYFRPFNFVAEEQIRKEHMVQYIFHPEFGWNRLRTERTGEFEAEILNPPNPDEWFAATITITPDRVQVHLPDSPGTVLDVPRLTTPASNKIGYWVGHNSSGRFDNLKVVKN